ncbi:organic cation transporter protein-like isoform X1 [Vanessa tameamea]|uniref:Organic cation transporter protein-like isoform X1 n=1 Tax=Vanessa tameamea TaxID=334116 RepID=A0A8B8IGK1_VANTA|nr:organic cation transporter protein-like [Vanessa tameamea]
MTATSNNCARSEDVYQEFEKFDRFQLFQYILVCLPLVTVSMMHVNYIFVAEDVEHRCLVSECEGAKPSVEIPDWWPKGVNARCLKPVVDMQKYDKSNQTCSNNTFLEILEECHEWVYENNNSIVAELNLGCQSWKSTLVGGIHNAGMVVSMIITGWIADKIGRKPTIIICSVGGLVGLCKIFITNFYLYLGVEFLESVLVSGLYTVAVVLLIELGGDSKRVLAGVIFSYAVYVGEVLFAFIAMGLKYWKLLIIVVYAPTVLYGFYALLLKESIRWQMIRGKSTEAKNTLKLVAKMNKLEVTGKEIDDISDEELRKKFDVVIQKQKETIKDILASKETMLRLAVTSFCFFTSSFVYYGLIVHSVLLPGNKYINFVLSSLTAFPGDYLAFLCFKKFGRNISLRCAYICSACFLIAQTYTPESLSWLKVALFLFGKLGVAFCFTGVYTYSLELFPTSVRGTLVGCGNTAARVGSMLAPLTPLLVSELDALPAILFSSTAVIAALLLTFTPETKTLPLFDTIAQIEHHKSKVMTHL